MFEDVLVVTDRIDLAEGPVCHREARERRFLARVGAVLIVLNARATGGGGPGSGAASSRR